MAHLQNNPRPPKTYLKALPLYFIDIDTIHFKVLELIFLSGFERYLQGCFEEVLADMERWLEGLRWTALGLSLLRSFGAASRGFPQIESFFRLFEVYLLVNIWKASQGMSKHIVLLYFSLHKCCFFYKSRISRALKQHIGSNHFIANALICKDLQFDIELDMQCSGV